MAKIRNTLLVYSYIHRRVNTISSKSTFSFALIRIKFTRSSIVSITYRNISSHKNFIDNK